MFSFGFTGVLGRATALFALWNCIALDKWDACRLCNLKPPFLVCKLFHCVYSCRRNYMLGSLFYSHLLGIYSTHNQHDCFVRSP